MAVWLASHRPTGAAATLIHGDYHLDNVMLAAKAPPDVVTEGRANLAALADRIERLGAALQRLA